MLDEHLADAVVGQVGVDGLAAEFGKGLKVLAESGILQVFIDEDFGDASQFGDLLGELDDGGLPIDLVGLLVLAEELEDLDELFRRGDAAVEGDAVVLIEDGAAGRLEEDVGERIALGGFGLDLALEVVVLVFGLPETVHESEVIDEDAISPQGLLGGAFELVLVYKTPAIRKGTFPKKVAERVARVACSGVPALWNERGTRNKP